jgi:hypothetical protein
LDGRIEGVKIPVKNGYTTGDEGFQLVKGIPQPGGDVRFLDIVMGSETHIFFNAMIMNGQDNIHQGGGFQATAYNVGLAITNIDSALMMVPNPTSDLTHNYAPGTNVAVLNKAEEYAGYVGLGLAGVAAAKAGWKGPAKSTFGRETLARSEEFAGWGYSAGQER